MWSVDAFAQLFALLQQPAELFTYSSSTAARSSLLAAGFYLARGVPSAGRSETTIALKRTSDQDFAAHSILGREWLDKRGRSTAKFAAGTSPQVQLEVEQRIREHPQFRD
jgi:queuine tRNA-ribosyltransferase